MEKREKNLSSLFRQLRDKTEKVEAPDLGLRNAVFSTVDATALVADIVDLFTFQFLKAQSIVIDAIPESEYGDEKQKLFKYLEQKRAKNRLDTEGDEFFGNEQNTEK